MSNRVKHTLVSKSRTVPYAVIDKYRNEATDAYNIQSEERRELYCASAKCDVDTLETIAKWRPRCRPKVISVPAS